MLWVWMLCDWMLWHWMLCFWILWDWMLWVWMLCVWMLWVGCSGIGCSGFGCAGVGCSVIGCSGVDAPPARIVHSCLFSYMCRVKLCPFFFPGPCSPNFKMTHCPSPPVSSSAYLPRAEPPFFPMVCSYFTICKKCPLPAGPKNH